MTKPTACMLYSPGVDSFVAKHIVEESKQYSQISYMYVDTSSAYTDYEKTWLKKKSGDMTPVQMIDGLDLRRAEDIISAHVKNRNLSLLAFVSGAWKADVYLLNGTADERVSDNTDAFYTLASNMLSHTLERNVTVTSAVKDYTKFDLVQKYTDNEWGTWIQLIEDTYSCYNRHFTQHLLVLKLVKSDMDVSVTFPGCLKCKACFRKCVALTGARVYLPFFNETLVEEYAKDIEQFEPKRRQAIMNYIAYLKNCKVVESLWGGRGLVYA